MPLTITMLAMRSTSTRHTARATSWGWSVTWLPGRVLSQSQAVTAMTIAETIGAHDLTGDPLHAGHRLWPHLDQWAAELGISGPAALVRASAAPEDYAQSGIWYTADELPPTGHPDERTQA
jgi:hypothetical protein